MIRMLPPLFCRRSSRASAKFIDQSLANISMSYPLNSRQDSAANAWKKEIFHQMNMFQFDCCLRHIPTPSSMPIQSLMTIQSSRSCSNSKAVVIRFNKIYNLFLRIFNLQFWWQLKNRSLPKRRSWFLFRLATKMFMSRLSRSRKSKSFKKLFLITIIMKSSSNNSLMTNNHKRIATPG